jgi:omega-6 fatty acid desaturase (delta-12 desaturase)
MAMTNFKKLALGAILLAPNVNAFAPRRLVTPTLTSASFRERNVLNVATVPSQNFDLTPGQQTPPPKKDEEDTSKFGAMMDLKGIAFSGLKGQALSLSPEDFPSASAFKAAIPKECFEVDTVKSLSYLSVSLAGTALCTLLGVAALPLLPPTSFFTLPFWTAYAAVTGTVAMGLWVLAHECGHGAFSKNKNLQDAVGYVLHSFLLVPYYSWQRSHAVHHKFTNHMELGETHVPEPFQGKKEGSYGARSFFIDTFGKKNGLRIWGGIQGFLHLVTGWPAYLLIGATGGPARGMTNHFYPDPLTTPSQPNKELFKGQWKEKVWKSDIGIAFMVGVLGAWGVSQGFAQVMALYGGPLLIVNAWLVLYTWLQHTDVDVPHFGEDDHNYMRGALHTIDRPYDKLDPWGAIDFLHHRIGSTHVAHHFDCTIPHYKARQATDAIMEAFPQVYFYDPTPIPEALWRVCKGCTAVEKRGDKWIWNNEGLEEEIQKN